MVREVEMLFDASISQRSLNNTVTAGVASLGLDAPPETSTSSTSQQHTNILIVNEVLREKSASFVDEKTGTLGATFD